MGRRCDFEETRKAREARLAAFLAWWKDQADRLARANHRERDDVE